MSKRGMYFCILNIKFKGGLFQRLVANSLTSFQYVWQALHIYTKLTFTHSLKLFELEKKPAH